MPKEIRDFPLIIAPGIIGQKIDGVSHAYDTDNGCRFNPNNVLSKIAIYERQVNGWFLDRATIFVEEEDNGLIVLMVCLAYLEGVEQYRVGGISNSDSPGFFKSALNNLYPSKYTDNELGIFYNQARCGLFHDGMTRSKIIYDYEYSDALKFEGSDIKVNPKILLEDIKSDFCEYIKSLKVSGELQDRFNAMFSVV